MTPRLVNQVRDWPREEASCQQLSFMAPLAKKVSTADISHGSIVVSIPRCGRGDPGSNPGRGRVT